MSENNDHDLRVWEEVYTAALALYEVIRTSGMIQVHRVEMKQGEVVAEPLDFKCDLEMRARDLFRTRNELILWWNVLEEPFRYPELPQYMQQELGRVIEKFDLGVGGHYRQLYFRVKNQIERKGTQETTDGSDSSSDGSSGGVELGATSATDSD